MPDKKEITLLFFGDIVGKPGRQALAQALPALKKQYQPDLTMANVENIAHGIGVTPKTLAECHQAGIDVFTSGNHIFKKNGTSEIFDNPNMPLVRPANYTEKMPGLGYRTISVGTSTILVINLNGQVFIEEAFSNPFHAIDAILASTDMTAIAATVVDFHAEATSEKTAFGWYVDGRVSAVFGTHTHVPTADETILPKGTAYITDVGMVGLKESVIGVDKDIIINNFLSQERLAHDIPDHGRTIINGVLVTINTTSKRATKIIRVYKEINV